MEITYYQLPLTSIPFHEIPSLENLKYTHVYCSSFSLIPFMDLDYYLVSVYDKFNSHILDIDELQKCELLFGKVVSDKFTTRGKAKCKVIGTKEITIEKSDLPHLKYNSNDLNPQQGNFFYMKEGKYNILSGIKSEFEKVNHLEGIAIYGDSLLRLRIVIELLKLNEKYEKVRLSISNYKDIAYKVLKTDPFYIKTDEGLIKDGVNNWVPQMLITPLYEDIPHEARGKVK